MKVPNWLYVVLLTVGLGGLTLLLSAIFFLTLQPYVSPDFDVFLIILAPFFVSTPFAYVIFSRRFRSHSQRRVLAGTLLSLLGMIMFLSGITIYLSSFGFWNPLDPVILIFVAIIGLPLTMEGFSLALPERGGEGVLRNEPAIADDLTSVKMQTSGYLPVAGVATLIATLLTFLIMFASIPTALGPCYGGQIGCPPPTMIVIGVISAIGFTAGIAASSSLLMGRYSRTVPIGIAFLMLTALISLLAWAYWFLLSLPVLALCLVSVGFTAWDQKDTMKVSDWRAVGILSASLGVIALVLGGLQFSYQSCNLCLGFCSRPYLNNAALLLSLGGSGIIISLMSLDSIRTSRGKPKGLLPPRVKQAEKSKFFQVLVILLTASVALSTVLSAALIAPSLNRCNFSCYTRTEQLSVTQVTFGPSANQVTFTLQNSGTSDVTITQIRVEGPGISNSTYATQLSTTLACAASDNLQLVASFQAVNFQHGVRYDFTLVSSQGNKFPTSAIL